MIDAAVSVRCRGLTKHYGSGEGSVPALRGVDLDVHAGELLMLAGPSGCGKTTLLSIIGGILEPDAGECEVMGRNLRAMDPEARARFRGRGIGFVFQSFNLLPALSAVDNVSLPLLLRGEAYAPSREKAREMLATLDLAGKDEAYPSQLSGGQQQRVAMARALVHQPALVICDEPTSNLDARNGHEVMELLRATMRAPERALVVVTHDPRIYDFADRIVRMEDGRIVDIDAPRGSLQ